MSTLKEFAKGMSFYSLSQSYVLAYDTYSPKYSKRIPRAPKARPYNEVAELYADWAVYDYDTDDYGRTYIKVGKTYTTGLGEVVRFHGLYVQLDDEGKIDHATDSRGIRRCYPCHKTEMGWATAPGIYTVEEFEQKMKNNEGIFSN